MPENKYTLSELREEVERRGDQVADLLERLKALNTEIEEILEEIDELEGVPSGRRQRKMTSIPDHIPDEDVLPPRRRGRPAKEDSETPKRRRRRAAGEPKPKKPKPPPRVGPSVVDVAVEILREEGRAIAPGELASRVEDRGVSAANTQRVLLMTAGRKKSRLAKDEDGNITLSDQEKEAVSGSTPTDDE